MVKLILENKIRKFAKNVVIITLMMTPLIFEWSLRLSKLSENHSWYSTQVTAVMEPLHNNLDTFTIGFSEQDLSSFMYAEVTFLY